MYFSNIIKKALEFAHNNSPISQLQIQLAYGLREGMSGCCVNECVSCEVQTLVLFYRKIERVNGRLFIVNMIVDYFLST